MVIVCIETKSFNKAIFSVPVSKILDGLVKTVVLQSIKFVYIYDNEVYSIL